MSTTPLILSTKQRLFVIIQLCLAFSLILWYASQPFMGEYFTLKSRMLLYEYVMGTSSLLKSDDQKAKLDRNKTRLERMNVNNKKRIEKDYENLYLYSTRSTLTKVADGLKTLLFDIPSFKLAWIIFTAFISIFLLIRKEGSAIAGWLLPCLALAYGIDSQLNGHPSYVSPDVTLFPTETVLIKEYLGYPLAHAIEEQRVQLKDGWNQYLVSQWGTDVTQSREEQIEQAEFNFTVARIKQLQDSPMQNWKTTFHEKSSLFWICIYIFWNLFFAWNMTRSLYRK